jgi:hypothetical protein
VCLCAYHAQSSLLNTPFARTNIGKDSREVPKGEEGGVGGLREGLGMGKVFCCVRGGPGFSVVSFHWDTGQQACVEEQEEAPSPRLT